MKRLWIAALAVGLAACGSGGNDANFTDPTDELEVVSWWVSPSERPALDVLVTAFKEANPDVTVDDASIAGGGGSNVQVALAARMRANDPPDVWQTFVGSSLRGWVDAGRVADVSEVYQHGDFGENIPKRLLDAATDRDKQWGVPTGAHRGNNLWFNTDVLTELGIAIPGPGYDWEKFSADLAAVKAKDKAPLCLGAKDRLASVELFENTLLGVVGVDGWKKIREDSFDWSGPQLKEALTKYGDLLSYADPDAGGLTWDQAAKRLAEGKCAFLSMNDSVYGELLANKAEEGEDFGRVSFPGTDGAYLAIVDTFVAAASTPNGLNAIKFLTTITDPAVTVEFNRVKGSVPVRKDVDVSSLPPYQQEASKALWSDEVLLSITHGELMNSAFQQAFYDAVAAFAGSKNQRAFINTLQTSTSMPFGGR